MCKQPAIEKIVGVGNIGVSRDQEDAAARLDAAEEAFAAVVDEKELAANAVARGGTRKPHGLVRKRDPLATVEDFKGRRAEAYVGTWI